MTLPVYEPSTLLRCPFAEYEDAYHVPTVAADLFDQSSTVYGKHEQNLEFKDLYDFTRNDSGTRLTPRGLATPGTVVPYVSTFVSHAIRFAVGVDVAGLASDESLLFTAVPMTGDTVIVDEAGDDIGILGTSELLSGSMYEKSYGPFSGIDFDYEISARSKVITPAPETTPFRLFHTTVHVPVESRAILKDRIARWSFGKDVFGAGSFSETVSPTTYSITGEADDIYILRLRTSAVAETTSTPSTADIAATVLGYTGNHAGDWTDPWISQDGDEYTTEIITTFTWPPGNMSVSGNLTGAGGTVIAVAELYRIRVSGLGLYPSLSSWATPL